MGYATPAMEYTDPEEITRLLGLPRPTAFNLTADHVPTDTSLFMDTVDLSLISVGDLLEFSDNTVHPIRRTVQITGFSDVGGWHAIFTPALTRTYTQATGSIQMHSYFTTETNPSRYQLQGMVEANEARFNEETHHAWFADGAQVNEEWYQFKGGHGIRRWPYIFGSMGSDPETYWAVPLNHTHIKQFDPAKGDSMKVYEGNTFTEWLGVRTEWDANTSVVGRTGDFWVDYKSGILYFLATRPVRTEKGVYLTYRYGGSDNTGSATCAALRDISKAIGLMTCVDLYRASPFSVNFPSGMKEETANLRIKHLIETWEREINRIIQRHKRILCYKGESR